MLQKYKVLLLMPDEVSQPLPNTFHWLPSEQTANRLLPCARSLIIRHRTLPSVYPGLLRLWLYLSQLLSVSRQYVPDSISSFIDISEEQFTPSLFTAALLPGNLITPIILYLLWESISIAFLFLCPLKITIPWPWELLKTFSHVSLPLIDKFHKPSEPCLPIV